VKEFQLSELQRHAKITHKLANEIGFNRYLNLLLLRVTEMIIHGMHSLPTAILANAKVFNISEPKTTRHGRTTDATSTININAHKLRIQN